MELFEFVPSGEKRVPIFFLFFGLLAGEAFGERLKRERKKPFPFSLSREREIPKGRGEERREEKDENMVHPKPNVPSTLNAERKGIIFGSFTHSVSSKSCEMKWSNVSCRKMPPNCSCFIDT